MFQQKVLTQPVQLRFQPCSRSRRFSYLPTSWTGSQILLVSSDIWLQSRKLTFLIFCRPLTWSHSEPAAPFPGSPATCSWTARHEAQAITGLCMDSPPVTWATQRSNSDITRGIPTARGTVSLTSRNLLDHLLSPL